MGGSAMRTWCAVLTALLALLATTTAAARYDIGAGRMAYTDWSASAGTQPRVWAVDIDGHLISKRIDVNEDGWTLYAPTGLSEDIAGVSFTDGATQRERIFFVQSGTVRTMPVNNLAPAAVASLPLSGFTLQAGTDLAAVSFLDGSTQRIAVAAMFASGRVCIWEGTYTSFTTSPWCSATGVATGLDIDGGVVAAAPSTPAFFFQSSSGLTRIRRTGASTYSVTNLGLPPSTTSLRPSVAVTTSVISTTRFEVAVLSNSGAHTARVNATEATVSSWTSLGFPAGESLSSDPEAVGITRWYNGLTDARMTFYVKPSDNELWFAAATSAGWSAGWTQSVPPQGDRFFGVGAAVEVPGIAAGLSSGLAYGATGANALVVAYYHLGEYDRASFDDHLTYQVQPGTSVLGFGETDVNTGPNAWFESNETSAAVWGLAGMATGIRRNGPPPWEVTIADTSNAGFAYSTGFVVAPVPSLGGMIQDSIADPYTAYSPTSSLAFHTSLQGPRTGTVADCPEMVPNQRQLVIRRGSSASVVADLAPGSSDLAILAQGWIDHPGLAVTGAPGAEIAHVVWWNKLGNEILYAQWGGGPPPTSTAIPGLPPYPPGALRDGSGRVWAWSGSNGTQSTICEIYPTVTGVCAITAGAAGPVPVAPLVTFGAAGPLDTGTGRICASGGQYRQCFNTDQPVSLFAHPVSGYIYATWQGLDPSSQGGASTSIYFSRSTNTSLGAWTVPVQVNPRVASSATFFVDPTITVDASGFVLITYSGIEPDQTAPTATVFSAYSANNGTSFAVAARTSPPTWQPAHLSIHCGKHFFFLGEYRDGSTFGEKHYQTYPYSQSGRVTQTGLWSSRRSVW